MSTSQDASTTAGGAGEASTSSASGSAIAIPVRLVSRSSKHAIPSSKFMIPHDWGRFQLSELINKVLGNTDAAVPFDFIIDEKLLRSSLGEWTKARGLTEETVLDVEYVESILPPRTLSSFEQEDWVSDIDLSQKEYFLTSAYDNNVRLFSSAGAQLQATLTGHTLPVLSTCWLPASPSSASSSSTIQHIASGGMDRVVRVWQVPTDDPSKAHATHALALHTAPVTSVRAGQTSSDGKKTLLTAGQDGLVGFWDFDPSVQDSTNGITEQDEDMPRSKKRRTAGGASTTGEKIVKVHPTLIMSGHVGQVSRAIFDNTSASRAVSFGQSDHSIRVWDLDMAGQEITSKRSDRAILDGTQLSTEAQIFASANADRSIAVWDLREENTIISLSLTGHLGPVSSVSSHPDNANLLASVSYDATAKVWDIRSPKQALFNLPRQTKDKKAGKLLCVQWNGEIVAAGGEDKTVELWQSKGV